MTLHSVKNSPMVSTSFICSHASLESIFLHFILQGVLVDLCKN